MIAFVKGILDIKLNGYVIVDVSGIGHKVYMSEGAIESLGNIGDIVKIYTYHQVKEDDENLFGFITMEELNMFELLISVSGIGAKSALNILANMEPAEFALAVVSNDTSKLVKIPGLGTKTAARVVLELKDKIKNENIVKTKETTSLGKNNNTEKKEEAISALQVLGYNVKEIEKVLENINIDELKLEDIIKQGLKYLSSK